MAPLLNDELLENVVSDNQILTDQNAIEYFKDVPVYVSTDHIDTLELARQIAESKNAQGDKNAFFVMNMGGVGDVMNTWRKCMPQVQPYYVLRCNSDTVLLSLLAKSSNLGLSCISRKELEIALKYVDKDRVLYNNPFWTRANLRNARQQGVSLVTITSEDDLYRFARYYPEAKVIMRLAMDPKLLNDAIDDIATSIDVSKGIELLQKAVELGVSISGLSIWLRTLKPTPQLFNYALAECRKLFDVGYALGHPMNVLNIGERIPQSSRSLALLACSLNESIRQSFPPDIFKNLQVIAQPSSLFAASHYSLVTSVISKKTVSAAMLTSDEMDHNKVAYIYQINDGYYGSFGGCVETLHEPTCCPLSRYDDKVSTYAAFIGPTVCETDVVRSLTKIEQMQVGEWLLWNDMGAYSMISDASTADENIPTAPSVHYFINRKHW